MRVLVLALVSAIACAAAAQAAPETTNMSCVERLEMPSYPRLADAARLSATVTTTIRVGRGGRIQGINSDVRGVHETAKSVFSKSIEDAARASKFVAACDGRTIKVEFRFSLGEQIGAERVSFDYPNRFTITAPAKVIQ